MDRTLFIAELPDYLKIRPNLQILMSQFGEVETIILNTPRSKEPDWNVFQYADFWQYDSAYVVYKKAKYLQKVLKLDLSERLLVSKTGNDLRTPEEACEDKNHLDLDAALKRGEEYMKKYALQQRAAEDAKEAAKESEDGWITVSKKYKPVETAAAAIKKAGKRKRVKKEKMQLVNFYAFQERERKVKAFKNNTREWQESLDKIAQMRQERKFKPL